LKHFWATVCETARSMLSDRCLTCPVLSVCLSVFDVGVLCPNGWNWMEWIKMPLGTAKATLCYMGTQLPSPPKKGRSLFGPCLLWPNGWMYQDVTFYGGRLRSRPYCVRWGPSSLPLKGAQPPLFGPCLLWPNGRMDQDVTWYEDSLGSGHIVLHGDPVSPLKGHSP